MQELIQDRLFAQGFGFVPGVGRESDIRPDPPGMLPWVFEDANPPGQPDGDVNRVAADFVIERDTPCELRLARYENGEMDSGDPSRKRRVAKRVVTDRKGNIRLYFNTASDLKNNANGGKHHWHLKQVFTACPGLAGFRRIDFAMDYLIGRQWEPAAMSSGSAEGMSAWMTLHYQFQIRSLAGRSRSLWLGGILYASDPSLYRIETRLGPTGAGFHREPVFPMPVADQQQSPRIELKALVRRALLAVASLDRSAGFSINPDDYGLCQNWILNSCLRAGNFTYAAATMRSRRMADWWRGITFWSAAG